MNIPVQLTKYQQAAVRKFLSSQQKRILFGLPTGTGKTVIGLTLVWLTRKQNPNAKILIITPAGLRFNFPKTNSEQGWNFKFFFPRSVQELEEHLKTDPSLIPIISFHFLGKYAHVMTSLPITWDLVIVDEVHYAKNLGTTFGKGVELILSKAKYAAIFTASYVANRLEEFAVLMSYLVRDSGLKQTLRRIKSIVELRKLVSHLKDYVFIVPEEEIRKELTSLPQTRYIKVIVSLNKTETYVYKLVEGMLPPSVRKKLAHGLPFRLDELPKQWVIAAQQVLISPRYLTKYVTIPEEKMKAIHALPPFTSKVLRCIDHIKNYPEKKRIVFVPFVEWGAAPLAKYIESSTGIKCLLYSGRLNEREREEVRDLFNNTTEYNVMILTLAGKEGINLPVTEEIHFLGYSWNPEDMKQVIGRALRLTSTVPVVDIYLYEAVKHVSIFDRISLKLFPDEKKVKRLLRTIDGIMLEVLQEKMQLKVSLTQLFGTKPTTEDLWEETLAVTTTGNHAYVETPSKQPTLITPYPGTGDPTLLSMPSTLFHSMLLRRRRKIETL